MQPDLVSAFNEYFELVPAVTPELKMEVFQLRYQVYVLETGFERGEDCRSGHDDEGVPIHWEEDEFDVRSEHYLIQHRRSGIYAATARLILPDPQDVMAPFPIESHCQLDTKVSDPGIRQKLGEISRFAVSKHFKRRLGEAGTITGVSPQFDMYFEDYERRLFPHISLGLFGAVMRMVYANGITHCYAVMEPALHRLIGRFGVIFNPIGPKVDYHGMRIPCLGTVDEALPSIKNVCEPVWDLITEQGRLLQAGAGGD
jgi:N-acyl amino acid synthase of PEP-CTERM/exosortase system